MLPQPGVPERARSPGLTGPDGRQRLCRAGPIQVAPRRVARQLAAHGAGRASQDRGHRASRMALGEPAAQGFTFGVTHVSVGSRSHGNTGAPPGL